MNRYAETLFALIENGDTKNAIDLIEKKNLIDYRQDEEYYTPLMFASECGQVEIVKHLIKKGAKINATEGMLFTPLTLASRAGHTEIVKLLLDAGAIVDIFTKEGKTPLIWACSTGRLEVARLLIAAGADVNAFDKLNCSALVWSYIGRRRNPESIELLMQNGAKLSEKEKRWMTKAGYL